ncbi:unnamed protein product [Ectocarpus sp. CCAP 1310/34]|nr:unnamed protein product [Ectocarpus sp. CCAP 1310/34]
MWSTVRVVLGVFLVLAVLGVAGREAGPATRKLRADPLSALEDHDLIDLLEIPLDDVFLLPETLPHGRAGRLEKNKQVYTNTNNYDGNNRERKLQASSPSPSLAVPTGAPTDGASRGISSSYFSSFVDSPSATPTASPTVGSDSRGGLFGSMSPSASPTAVESDSGPDFDDGFVDDVPRQADSALRRGGGGGSSAGVVVAAMTMAVVAFGKFLP